MKRIVLTTGLVLSALISTYAQSGAQYWSLGPVLGFGGSWLTGLNNQDFMPSGEVGLGVIYSRHEHWGFGADLTGSSEGYSVDYMKDNISYHTDVMPVYLRLTPKAYYFFGEYGDVVRPKLYLGPSVAYKMSEEQSMTKSSNVVMSDVPATVAPRGDVFNDWDFGIKVGAGANIQLAKSVWFNADAGYYQGLADVTGMDNMNSHLRLNLGVMFGL